VQPKLTSKLIRSLTARVITFENRKLIRDLIPLNILLLLSCHWGAGGPKPNTRLKFTVKAGEVCTKIEYTDK